MKTTIIASILSLIIGLFIGHVLLSKAPVISHDMTNMPGMNSTMDSMVSGLSGKTGDAFDKAFIEEMVVHHQGAVAMAQSALNNGRHAEIKNLANAIISAQNKEIGEMKAWYKKWYKTDLP